MPKEEKETKAKKVSEELCKKHSIRVDACGCCGSPYLIHMKEDHPSHANLTAAVEHLRSGGTQ